MATISVICELRGGASPNDGRDNDRVSLSTTTTKTTKKTTTKKGKSGKKTGETSNVVVVGGDKQTTPTTRTTTTTTNIVAAAAPSPSSGTLPAVKDAIDDILRDKDAASALGNAIRNRADELLCDFDGRSYSERAFNTAIGSVGLALGTAGTDVNIVDGGYRDDDTDRGNKGQEEEEEGLDQRPASVLIAEYFLKTHGGTHIVQSWLSLLASVLGVICLFLPSFPSSGVVVGTMTVVSMDATALARHILLSTTKCQLLQQTLLLAMAKYASGIFGAVYLSAYQIPQVGVRDVRQRLERVASDPVGQYLFYCSLLAVWMGWFGGGGGGGRMGEYIARMRVTVSSIMNAAAAASASTATTANDSTPTAKLLDALSQQPPPWFLCQSPYGVGNVIPLLLLGPILLREVISVVWVCSDVLTLLSTSLSGMAGMVLSRVLSISRATIDVVMCVLISRVRWRDANSFQRQLILSSLVSRISLWMELAVGGILMVDAALSIWTYAFIGYTTVSSDVMGGGRVPFRSMLGKTVCTHLYFNFLLSRRKKVGR